MFQRIAGFWVFLSVAMVLSSCAESESDFLAPSSPPNEEVRGPQVVAEEGARLKYGPPSCPPNNARPPHAGCKIKPHDGPAPADLPRPQPPFGNGEWQRPGTPGSIPVPPGSKFIGTSPPDV